MIRLPGGRAWAAVLAAAAALGAAALPAQEASFSATLSGEAVVPPVETTASGEAVAVLVGTEVEFTLRVAGIEGATQAHVHLGAPGENGPVVAFLFGPVDEGVDEIDVSGTLSVDDLIGPLEGDPVGFLEAVQSGNTYVQVHTLTHPGGELRGQIVVGGAVAEPEAVDGLPATGSGGLAGEGGGVAAWWIAATAVALAGVAGAAVVRVRR